MRAPVSGLDLLGDEPVRRFLVGDAQERLGQTHERNPFLVGKTELLQERVKGAGLSPLPAAATHQVYGRFPGRLARLAAEDRRGDKSLEKDFFRRMGRGADGVAQRVEGITHGAVLCDKYLRHFAQLARYVTPYFRK
ncbi:hypothetical protein HRUBRA_00738 [Pseudohaliea rubra DSM 19751]|uniref:Uncharacterized protein n=1 Tax=Pseudohaliea rubra DSM 19751 TaxID=1265313 RepID=A0A095X161_9GAMM|nr:hypothetical protein HRUBRA_00738 [Pseudohaliea rubra DSM 19751]